LAARSFQSCVCADEVGFCGYDLGDTDAAWLDGFKE
jgi:hypothetical protein